METIDCKALVVFTEFVSGYGMVVGNPDEDSVTVPASHVAKLFEEGKIDGDAIVTIEEPSDDYQMVHLGFGKYEVSGPGIEPGTIIKGKADAETLIETARAGSDETPPA